MKILHLQLTMVKILLWLILYSASAMSFAENTGYLKALESEALQKIEQNKTITISKPAKTKTAKTKALKESDYLKGLSAEAESTNLDSNNIISTKELNAKNTTTKIEHWNIYSQNLNRLRPGLEWKEFEKVLKNSYFASYVFYKRLNPTSKNLVFKEYEMKANIKQLRSKIISLSR
ncbi:MAG: hypothetical protein KAT06_06570 [Gammaproteobacteria bacterium]|nr:hypothetical protein [Gammaproteobacteria bacterium]